MTYDAIIPAAGRGTRLWPLTAAVPKELLPLGPKPVLQWIAEEVAGAGARQLVIVNSPDKPELERLFQARPPSGTEGPPAFAAGWPDGSFAAIPVQFAVQAQPRGLGHAVHCGRELVRPGASLLIALGDCVFGPAADENLSLRLLEIFERERAEGVIAFEEVSPQQVSRYGIASPASRDNPFVLRDVIEKPSLQDAPSRLAIAARYVFSPAIFEFLGRLQPGQGGELQLTDAIRQLIRSGGKVCGFQSTRVRRFDIGNYASYLDAFRQFAQWYPAGGS